MSRGFLAGLLAGAVVALGLGYTIAVVPSTPTWTLWEIKRALDADDMAKLRAMVDAPTVAMRAISELASGSGDALGSGLDYKDVVGALLTGRKVLTVFNDPERPLRLGVWDFLAAWWSMRREGNEARLAVDAGGREISLVLAQGDDGRWRVAGLTPLSALLRVAPPAQAKGRAEAQAQAEGGEPAERGATSRVTSSPAAP